MNVHNQEWLSSVSGTDCHGVSAYDFSNLSRGVQLNNGPICRLYIGNCLDLFPIAALGVVNCVYNSPDSINAFNDFLTSRRVPTEIIIRRIINKAWFEELH